MLCWDKLTPEAREALMLAHGEADRLGHAYEGGEHVLLGLLGLLAGGENGAARLLTERGLDLAEARAGVRRIVAETTRPDGAAALRGWGIDVAEVRRQLEAGFGAVAVREATWQVARRPWWRGGGRVTPPWRKPVLYGRALELAARRARHRREALVSPEHLLYGVLADAREPLGTGLSRRGRKNVFAQTGLREGGPHTVRLLLDACGIDIDELV
jgi:Clp amino terminal domain, pathogenicity island component